MRWIYRTVLWSNIQRHKIWQSLLVLEKKKNYRRIHRQKLTVSIKLHLRHIYQQLTIIIGCQPIHSQAIRTQKQFTCMTLHHHIKESIVTDIKRPPNNIMFRMINHLHRDFSNRSLSIRIFSIKDCLFDWVYRRYNTGTLSSSETNMNINIINVHNQIQHINSKLAS